MIEVAQYLRSEAGRKSVKSGFNVNIKPPMSKRLI